LVVWLPGSDGTRTGVKAQCYSINTSWLGSMKRSPPMHHVNKEIDFDWKNVYVWFSRWKKCLLERVAEFM
jgi:hypothetical protein